MSYRTLTPNQPQNQGYQNTMGAGDTFARGT